MWLNVVKADTRSSVTGYIYPTSVLKVVDVPVLPIKRCAAVISGMAILADEPIGMSGAYRFNDGWLQVDASFKDIQDEAEHRNGSRVLRAELVCECDETDFNVIDIVEVTKIFSVPAKQAEWAK